MEICHDIALDMRCVRLDVTAQDWREAVQKAGLSLVENGYITPSYLLDVIEREEQWPTGLPTLPVGVAIPHALKGDNVVVPHIAACRLTEPVVFCQSGGVPGEDDLDVRLVFLLALKDPREQLSLLQKLMAVISDEDVLASLLTAGTPEEFSDIFNGSAAKWN